MNTPSHNWSAFPTPEAMREIFEFRIEEKDARRFLEPGEGEVLAGGVRKVQVEARERLFARIGEIDRQFQRQGSVFVLSWSVRRKYTKAELEAAQAFFLKVSATFEPEGERCGTEYDESTACPRCGAGARQLNELRLESGSPPHGKALARTIAYSEVIASARLVEALRANGMTGARFLPVLRKEGDKALEGWHQLEVCSRPLQVVPPTRFGKGPFDDDEAGEYRCPEGHVAGLRLLSELSLDRNSLDGSDIYATQQQVGMRSRNGGVFRPYPLLVISPRLRRALEEMGAKGFELEVAHLASPTAPRRCRCRAARPS